MYILASHGMLLFFCSFFQEVLQQPILQEVFPQILNEVLPQILKEVLQQPILQEVLPQILNEVLPQIFKEVDVRWDDNCVLKFVQKSSRLPLCHVHVIIKSHLQCAYICFCILRHCITS